MPVQVQNSMKRAIALASAAAMGLAFSAPAAIARDNEQEVAAEESSPVLVAQLDEADIVCPSVIPPTGDEFDPLTVFNMYYSLNCWDLERESFICVNNPNRTCGNPIQEIDLGAHTPPEPRYEYDERGGFVCVNNVNPECDNPVHYGVIYDEAAEETDLGARTSALWAELDELASRPTALPAPPPAPAPPPIAPVPGLW